MLLVLEVHVVFRAVTFLTLLAHLLAHLGSSLQSLCKLNRINQILLFIRASLHIVIVHVVVNLNIERWLANLNPRRLPTIHNNELFTLLLTLQVLLLV